MASGTEKIFPALTSNILFEQRRFGLGCPSLYQVKWQEENENQPIYSYFSSLPRTNWKIYVVRRVWMPDSSSFLGCECAWVTMKRAKKRLGD